MSRKAGKEKEFMRTNICDISSYFFFLPFPLALGVPNAEAGLAKTARHKGIFW